MATAAETSPSRPTLARLRDDELTAAQRDGVFVRGECDPSVKVDGAGSQELGSTLCTPNGRFVEYPTSWVVHATARAGSNGNVLELHTVVSDVDPPRFLSRGQWSEFYFLPTSAAIGHVAAPITETREGPGHAFECSDLICIVGSNRDAVAFACGEDGCAERAWPGGVPKRVPRAMAPACEDDYLSEHESPPREIAPGVLVQIVTGACEDDSHHLEFTRVRVGRRPRPSPRSRFGRRSGAHVSRAGEAEASFVMALASSGAMTGSFSRRPDLPSLWFRW